MGNLTSALWMAGPLALRSLLRSKGRPFLSDQRGATQTCHFARSYPQFLWSPCFALQTSGAQSTSERSFSLKEIAPKVWVAFSNPRAKEPAGANTGFVIGDEGVAVIDTTMTFGANGFSIDVARQIVAAIRERTSLPIKFVINTHHHLDHVAANTVLMNEGAVVIAHENVRRWIHSEHLRVLPTDVDPKIRGFMEALAPPTITLDQSLRLHLGSRVVQVQA